MKNKKKVSREWLIAVHHRDGNVVFEFPTRKEAEIFRGIVEKEGYPTLISKKV